MKKLPLKSFLICFNILFFFSCSDYLSLKINDVELNVEIADTDDERARGLMFRESLDEYTGMLFVYEEEKVLYYWMKNVSFPLSIAFIDGDGIIRTIKYMQAYSEKSVSSIVPVQYALEVNLGFFKEHNIKAGDYVELPAEIRE